ncbi:MAG: alpha/beta fold hydrolase [Candidatus Binatia bacterium]
MTDEKFELALERLRIGKKAQRRLPVVLSHGFFVNSLFLNLDEDHSLGQYLAKEGFDVWNLSFRGTGRSLSPLKGTPKSWTLDEMIDQDFSVVIRYIQKESRSSKVSWVGYEMGGLLAYGYLGKKGGSGLAALVTIGSPATFSHPHQEPLKRLLGLDESPTLKKIFLSLNGPFLGRLLIPLVPRIERLFYNPDNIEDEVKEKLLEDALTEINPGVLDHLLLMIRRGEFVSAKGDFSYWKNLAKVQLPLLLIGGEKDMLAPPEAIRAVHRSVGSADRTLRIFGPGAKDSAAYGHLDLILGRKSKQEIFPVIGRWLKQRDGRQ